MSKHENDGIGSGAGARAIQGANPAGKRCSQQGGRGSVRAVTSLNYLNGVAFCYQK